MKRCGKNFDECTSNSDCCSGYHCCGFAIDHYVCQNGC